MHFIQKFDRVIYVLYQKNNKKNKMDCAVVFQEFRF